MRRNVLVLTVALAACEKPAQEKVAEHQLRYIEAQEAEAKETLRRLTTAPTEDELEKLMPFECAEEWRKFRPRSAGMSQKCSTELNKARAKYRDPTSEGNRP